jgi:hypothetical protein
MPRNQHVSRLLRSPNQLAAVPSRHGRIFPFFKWKRVWIGGIVSSLAVAAMAVLRGRMEGRPSCVPLNAISHIIWGRSAAKQKTWTLRYTGLGLVLNGVACVFWAGFFHTWRRTVQQPHAGSTSVLAGIGTSVVAYITDYYLVPRRFTPGFELCLTKRSFPWLYGALAIGLLAPQLVKKSKVE